MITDIICGFPGIGKSFYAEGRKRVLDSDSSTFPRGKVWPGNYMDHIESKVGKAEVILVSTHSEVVSAVADRFVGKIPTMIVYPRRELKQEYLDRFYGRGSPDSFISLMDQMWDGFLDDVEASHLAKYALGSGKYLHDFLLHHRRQNRLWCLDYVLSRGWQESGETWDDYRSLLEDHQRIEHYSV